MWIKATNLIFQPIKNEYSQTNYLKPNKIGYFDSDYQLLDLFIKLYQNCVFNIMYYRVLMPGKYFKYYGLKAIKLILILFLFNIFKILIQGIKFFFFKKKLSFFEFLYLNYENTLDERKLLFINGVWNANPKNLGVLIHNNFTKNKSILVENQTYKEVYAKTIDLISDRNPCPDYINAKSAYHLIDNKIFSHIAIENPTKNNDHEYYYMTDAYKAYNADFYNKKPLLAFFTGPEKPSTIFPLENNCKLFDINYKIPYKTFSLEIFKNEKFIIDNNLPTTLLPETKIFNQNIQNDVDYLNYKWDKYLNIACNSKLTEKEALDVFLNVLNQ